MAKFDRMEFPKKYPIPNWLKLLVVVLVFCGILIHNCTQEHLSQEIVISDVKIIDYSRAHIEVTYNIYNKSSLDRDVWLLLFVSDSKGEELASTLFLIKIKAGENVTKIKIIDKLNKPLINNIKPEKATIEVYKRKVFS